MKQAILFDLDGVLVDSRTAITSCINHALAANGLTMQPMEALLKYIGPPLASAFAEMSGEPTDSPLVAACVGSYRDRYAEVSLRETTAVSGIGVALQELGRSFRLAVATSKPRVFAEPLLDAVGLRGFFEFCAGPDLNLAGEEKAVTIAAALAELECSAAAMVGDRWLDINGARKCGIAAIGVTWGIGTVDELVAARPDALVHTPQELPGAIIELGAGRSSKLHSIASLKES